MSLRQSRARMLALMMTVVISLTILPVASFAGTTGRRNTAIGLGAAAIYLLAKKKTGPGVVAAAGSLYAYKRYKDAKQSRRYYSSRSRYNRYSKAHRSHNYRHASNRHRGHRYASNRSNYRYARHDNGRHRGWYKNKKQARSYGRCVYCDRRA